MNYLFYTTILSSLFSLIKQKKKKIVVCDLFCECSKYVQSFINQSEFWNLFGLDIKYYGKRLLPISLDILIQFIVASKKNVVG